MELFIAIVRPKRGDKILDLGGSDGSVWDYLGERKKEYDIYIADIDEEALMKAAERGYKTIQLNEHGELPFTDKEFDVVFCNSMIEHYTIEKNKIWDINDDHIFDEESQHKQQFLANEIERVGKKYFVQTPHRNFPIESHTQFPFTAFLSRKNQLRLIKFLNKYWLKKTQPDWHLLGTKDAKKIFPNANILINKLFFFPREIIIYK